MTFKRGQLKPENKAPISEIFASIQGEGLFVGERQVFVRFANCNLKCDYCDTNSGPAVHQLVSAQVIKRIKNLKSKVIHSVSLTGGEPLLYADFLQELIPQIKKPGLKIYLETNGTLPEELRKIIRFIDYVAMDIKLPSSGNRACWEKHKGFLDILNGSHIRPGDFFVKVVLTDRTREVEIKKTVGIIADVSRHIPLVLQPVTPMRNSKRVLPKNIFAFQEYAWQSLCTVEVIPQIHKILHIR